MSENSTKVNVEKIMQEIREEAKRNGGDGHSGGLANLSAGGSGMRGVPREMTKALQYINANYDIPYYWDMGPHGPKTALKRLVRKMMKCLIPPIMARQNEMNANFVRCINALSNMAVNQLNGLNDDRKQMEMMTKRMDAHVNATEALAASVNGLDRDIECIRRVDGSIFEQKDYVRFERYSQSGEDSIIAFVFGALGFYPKEVTYLDLGANHARDLSNTYYFYQHGASGVLVEANPNLIPELKLLRPRDTILNNCVSDNDDETIEFYLMSGDGLSTVSRESVEHAMEVNDSLEVFETVKIKTISVNRIMERYFTETPLFLNVDIEGCEMEVLRSIDFDKYRPLVIVAEVIPYEAGLVIGKKNAELIEYLQSKGYEEYAFTGINSIFIDKKRVESAKRDKTNISGPQKSLLNHMSMNEHAGFGTYGVCIRNNGTVYGPYLTCGSGKYSLTVEAVVKNPDVPVCLTVMAGKGEEVLAKQALISGKNRIDFVLDEQKESIEFIINNETGDDLFVTGMDLKKN